ncbi:hypothetical protein EK21DRAFT_93256 [Setomelanomma holmii]|uniref:Uncharacterized protein n=1 Tax=Setomelanomma holmii TaxID=210430 RepID=A0A9P4LHF9_9PLEO|nr:hypothetical protein EK21DRAFT_93256 [Setomelanomma holmii]
MASPQESITTVSGRRCTRSRARTAVSSIFTTSEATVVTPTEVTTSTTAEQAPQIQTSAEAPPPPPASSSTTAQADQPAATPTTTQAAVSSAAGTISAIPTPKSTTTPIALAIIAPSEPAAAAPPLKGPVGAAQPAVLSSQAVVIESAFSAIPTTTSSNTISTAVLLPNPNQSTPSFTASGAIQSAVLQTSLTPDPAQSSQVDSPSDSTSVNTPIAALPPPTTTSGASRQTGDAAAGIIAPEQGGGGDSGLTIPSTGNANIGGIVGGVLGGVAGLALISALLFFCLRKRKSKEPRWIEKRVEAPRFVENVKAIPAGVGVMFAKARGMRKGPAGNPYRRHSQNESVSSIYSTNTNGRVRSMSEPQGLVAGDPLMRRSSSRKSERNLLRKKNGSISSQLAFAGILEEKDTGFDPFADPEPPRILHLSNPDAASPRGPVTPQPAATSARLPNNPFASPFDDPANAQSGSKVSLPIQGHRRNQSAASALSSHPPSFIFPGPSPTINKGPTGLPPPNQALLPKTYQRRSSMALPTFDTTSTGASRDSELLRFGEPGPSRPGTNLFTPGLPTGRTVRQSDPFDLDRPEVLGFGNVVGRREVRASVTRQATRGKRTSSAGNWGSTNDGPYPPLNFTPFTPRR